MRLPRKSIDLFLGVLFSKFIALYLYLYLPVFVIYVEVPYNILQEFTISNEEVPIPFERFPQGTVRKLCV